jgi:putative nucleotidyltransferase with HDIG domain
MKDFAPVADGNPAAPQAAISAVASTVALAQGLAGAQILAETTSRALVRALELHDPATGLHHRRVARLAVALAGALDVPAAEVEAIRLASGLHDIGKLGVPRAILDRREPLAMAELRQLQSHAELGYGLLCDLGVPRSVAEIVLQHHERLDGSGYPAGLAGSEIRRGARIVAVADVVEAMVGERPYRGTPGLAAALSELRRGSGTLYDPAVVAACVALCARDPALVLPERDPLAAAGAGVTQALRPAAPKSRLTSQQQLVMHLLVEGRSTKEIAGAMGLGLETVKAHLSHAYATLGVRNRAGAVRVVTLDGALRGKPPPAWLRPGAAE